MIRLEIIGQDADEFLLNARKTLGAFGNPGEQIGAEQPAGATLSATVTETIDIVEASPGKVDIFPPGEVLTTDNSAVINSAHTADVAALDKAEEKPRRGRPVTKKQEVQEAASEPVNSNPAPATLTIEELRTRVREIMTAFEKKEYAARAVEKGKDKTLDKTVMEASVLYCKQLFLGFSIAKISDLPAEKYAEFMAHSQTYLDGLAG